MRKDVDPLAADVVAALRQDVSDELFLKPRSAHKKPITTELTFYYFWIEIVEPLMIDIGTWADQRQRLQDFLDSRLPVSENRFANPMSPRLQAKSSLSRQRTVQLLVGAVDALEQDYPTPRLIKVLEQGYIPLKAQPTRSLRELDQYFISSCKYLRDKLFWLADSNGNLPDQAIWPELLPHEAYQHWLYCPVCQKDAAAGVHDAFNYDKDY